MRSVVVSYGKLGHYPIRAHLAEFGVVAPVGRNGVEELLKVVADAGAHRRVLAAAFAPDAGNRLHEVGATLDFLPIAALLINWNLWRDAAWRSARWMLLLTAGLPLLTLVIFVGCMAIFSGHAGHPDPGAPVGWPNRIMILAHCAWLMPIGWHMIAATRRPRREIANA